MAIRHVTVDRYTWLDIAQPTDEDLAYLRAHYAFHPLDYEDVESPTQRAKLDEYDDYLFIVWHFPAFDKRLRVTKAREVDIFVGDAYLITVHADRIWPLERFFEGLQQSETQRQESMAHGVGFLLYRILDKLVDNCFPVAHKIERNVHAVEDDVFEQPGRRTVEEISRLRRDIIATRRIMKPLIPVVARLEHIRSRLLGDELDVYFSDIGDSLARIWDTLEDQKGVIETLSDTHDSLLTHRTNEVVRMLTVLSVVMLPLTLISGIFGMNVDLPWDHLPHAFWMIEGLMILTAVGMLVAFRQRHWI